MAIAKRLQNSEEREEETPAATLYNGTGFDSFRYGSDRSGTVRCGTVRFGTVIWLLRYAIASYCYGMYESCIIALLWHSCL